MKTETIKELIKSAEKAVRWMNEATMPNEINDEARALKKAIASAKAELKKTRKGYLVLVAIPGIGRRITVTVEQGDRYLKRSGLESAGVKASVLKWIEVSDIHEARRALKEEIDEEYFVGMGMGWSDIRVAKLKDIMNTVANRANG